MRRPSECARFVRDWGRTVPAEKRNNETTERGQIMVKLGIPQVAAVVLVLLAPGLHELDAQELEVRVSIKIALDKEGNRLQEQDGWLYENARIERFFDLANEILATNGTNWRLRIVEIVELSALADWFGPVDAFQARDAIEAEALRNPELYGWRFDALNLFIVNETHDAIGVCSSPTSNGAKHTIVAPNVWVPEMEFTPEQFEFDWAVFFIHEIGHFFNLCHTHGCCCNVVCEDAVDPARWSPRGDDGLADTLPDLDCWGTNEVAQWSFSRDYGSLEDADKEQVDRTFLNIMSYHWYDRMERLTAYFTADQLARMAFEMDPLRNGRRTGVLNLPQARFSILGESVVGEELTFDAGASSTVPGHTITSYQWEFVDGGTDTEVTAKRTYKAAGVYRARLVVGDDRGLFNVIEEDAAIRALAGEVAPWQAVIVGEPSAPAGARFNGGCVETTALAGKIGGRSDDGHHFTHQDVAGDFELTARIETWPVETTNSKLGLVVRESLDPDARAAMLVLDKRSTGFRHRFLQRSEVGAIAQSTLRETYPEPTVWMHLEREGNVLSASLSLDGVTWLEPDAVELPELAETLYAGVASSWTVPGPGGPAPAARLCDLSLVAQGTPIGALFLRGDCNGDGEACSGVSDALELLSWLFLGRGEPSCLAACDPDGNGELELADVVYGLNFCFQGTDSPVAPFPGCGPGTDAALSCEASACE